MPTADTTEGPTMNGVLASNRNHHYAGCDVEHGLGQTDTKEAAPALTKHAILLDTDLSALSKQISALYSPAVEAKIWAVASEALAMSQPPSLFPEYTRRNGKGYVYRDLEFWTSGFFPGTLYQMLYRSRRYPSRAAKGPHDMKLEFACRWWTERLHGNANMTTTHDLGFMIAPWARPAWELNHDTRAFETLKLAAKSLLSRFSPTVGLFRSWDTCSTMRYSFQDPSKDFLTVIDNMMNLDMLFYVASHTKDQALWDAARKHAETTQATHIRQDHSTTHLVVFDTETGSVQQHLTNQGYDHDSCWTRGQAWAICGFAETYGWTRDVSFLETARSCADYFLSRLPATYIPPWDFDAALNEDEAQPPDTSAAMVAAYGMLLIYRALTGLGDVAGAQEYLVAALRITSAVCGSYTDKVAHFAESSRPVETVEQGVSQQSVEGVCNGGGDTIVMGATINNYRFASRRWANHGLVYADYYFVLVGNMLLDIGIGKVGMDVA